VPSISFAEGDVIYHSKETDIIKCLQGINIYFIIYFLMRRFVKSHILEFARSGHVKFLTASDALI
jgi:hypothetical protein